MGRLAGARAAGGDNVHVAGGQLRRPGQVGHRPLVLEGHAAEVESGPAAFGPRFGDPFGHLLDRSLLIDAGVIDPHPGHPLIDDLKYLPGGQIQAVDADPPVGKLGQHGAMDGQQIGVATAMIDQEDAVTARLAGDLRIAQRLVRPFDVYDRQHSRRVPKNLAEGRHFRPFAPDGSRSRGRRRWPPAGR